MPPRSFLRSGRLLAIAGAAAAGVATPFTAASLLAQTTARAPAPAISAAGDGPYVEPDGKGWIAHSISSDLAPVDTAVAARGKVRVNAVGDAPAFDIPLRAFVQRKGPDTLSLDAKAKLLVLADTHGEYEIVIAFLRAQGVVDEKLRWSFGKGQMVVTGDMFDRGPHQLEILWLFYKLEAEAKEAGGALHVLLGNHESMVLRGDIRYLHPRYPEGARILGRPSYSALFTSQSLLGNWLRSRPAVLKLGDLLFLHGGISPPVVDAGLGIGDLNKGIRTAIDTPAEKSAALDEQTKLIAGSNGPQWYRGYFAAPESRMHSGDVERALAAFGVSRILVGHTPVDRVTALYGGKVIAVQVYPHRDETSNAPVLEGALREKGVWYRIDAQGRREKLAFGAE